MRVLILTLGTRGDVEVFLTLARELMRRSHDVTFAASGFFEPAVCRTGAHWLPIGPGTQSELVEIMRAIGAIDDPRERVKAYASAWVRPQLAQGLPQVKAIAGQSDYFINNLRSVWQRGGAVIPGAEVTYDPPADIDRLSLYASHQPENASSILQLVAMNRQLLDPQDQWGNPYHFTGFWHAELTEPYQPPQVLSEFLAAESPPIVLTMGSMVMFDPQQIRSAFREALRLAGERGVLITSWSGRATAADGDDQICVVDEAPYDWLFPRAAGVLHHGGCGTVAAVLKSGVPSILMPQIVSQFHFTKLLEQAGLVAGVVDAREVSSQQLAVAIRRAIDDEALRARCSEWRNRVAEDAGVTSAVDAIEQHAGRLGLVNR